MTDKEAFNFWVKKLTGLLREKDIAMGVMDENYEPLNGLLPARENKRCWEYLAEQLATHIMHTVRLIDVGPDFICNQWLAFLPMVEDVVKHGMKNDDIESVINSSGISKETWIKFLSGMPRENWIRFFD